METLINIIQELLAMYGFLGIMALSALIPITIGVFIIKMTEEKK
jgi:hypothetical protein